MSKRVNNSKGKKPKEPPCKTRLPHIPGTCRRKVDDAPTPSEIKRMRSAAIYSGNKKVISALDGYKGRGQWPSVRKALREAGALYYGRNINA